VSRPLSVTATLALAIVPFAAEAFVCGRSLSSGDLGETAEEQIGEPGSLECLVDNLLTEQVKGLGLAPNETISTQMVSVNIGAVDGRPEVRYTFHYSIGADQFDHLGQMWTNERGRFDAAASQFSEQFAKEVCATGRPEADFLAAGGRVAISVKLSSSVEFKQFFYEELVGMEITDCEAN
jgi:hypothetical protein